MTNNNTTYKPSSLGMIPSDWEVKELGKFAKVTSGGTPSRENKSYWDGDIPWITTSLIDFNEISTAEQFITENGLNNSSTKIFPAGTLLMALYGQGVTRGKTAILNIDAATNQACAAILLNNEKVVTKYIFQYLISKYDDIRKLSNTGNQENLNGELVKSIRLRIPPLPEQKAIADCLSTWDEAINKTSQLIAQKEQSKKWLMQNLLTGKKRLKGFSGEWKEYSYEKLLKVVKRNFDWDENALYKLISVRRRSGGIFFRDSLYGHQILVKNLRTANQGDFLFSKMQILHGASALITKEFDGAKISGSYIAVVAQNTQLLSMEFFQWYSQMPYFYHQTYISSYGVHIEKMTFDFETFLQLQMSLPSIEEQTAIAQVLQTADKELQLLKNKLAQLKEQKKGLMQVLLTGRKRLKI